jgi:TolB-like protein/DNA-binding SARP family transcriptional activator
MGKIRPAGIFLSFAIPDVWVSWLPGCSSEQQKSIIPRKFKGNAVSKFIQRSDRKGFGDDEKQIFEEETRIFLLGRTEARGPDGSKLLPNPAKTKAVFAYLCLHRGEVLARTRIADLIWDRSGTAQSLDALRHALLDLNHPGAAWRLERERHTVRLDASVCWIDAFEIPDHPDRLLEDLQGVSVSFDHWILEERARFETRWRAVLERNLQSLIAESAAPARRASAARQLLAVLPTHDAAVRGLMKAFVDMDEPAEAIREFERYRLLANDAGIPVAHATLALYSAIRVARRAPRSSDSHIRLSASPRDAESDHADAAATMPTVTGSIGPSIAVLPLRNLSGSDACNGIVEGIAEDLVETLSRIPDLFVVSRLSTEIFRNYDRSPQQIGMALGVRYLISGSVRINDDRVRLVVELVEAETGKGIWRHRFDERISHVLDMQSESAEAVVRAIAPQLRAAEMKRTRIKRPEDYTAYDLLLRAQESMHSASRSAFENAKALFDSAIERDPHYATVLAWRAYWHVMRVGQGWSSDRALDTQLAEAFAQQAIDRDPTEAMAFAVQGHAAAYLKRDYDLALGCFERALEINPNSARAWLWSANVRAWMSQGAMAVDDATRAISLSPYDPLASAYSGTASAAYFADKQYERAIEFAMRAIHANSSYRGAHRVLVPALVLAGRVADARHAANRLLRLEPNLTVQEFRRSSPGARGEIGERLCEGLRGAGIPASD